jgi:hypothetical protein
MFAQVTVVAPVATVVAEADVDGFEVLPRVSWATTV